jgi:soluble lytic murein transglycosylase
MELFVRSSKIYFALITLMLANMLGANACLAAMYSYTDNLGILHFTNVPGNPQYKPIWVKHRHTFPANQEYLYDAHIRAAAHFFGLDPSLIKAVIRTESDFNPRAVSPRGAIGLMQLMPDTAREMNVADLYDPRENIFGGSRYLKHLSKLFAGNLNLILASYNAGPKRILLSRTVPNIRETQQFIKSVRQFYRHYRKMRPL